MRKVFSLQKPSAFFTLTVYAACGPYERRAVRNGLKPMFQTGKDSILYATGEKRRSVQKMSKSCTRQAKSDVSYRKKQNPVRINEILAKRAG